MKKPSIEFLELYMLYAGIITWQNLLSDCRIVVHCDNKAVISMVNTMMSSCKYCMHIIRLLTLNALICNRRVSVIYVKSKDNVLSDTLSRLNFAKFRKFGQHMNNQPDLIHQSIKPADQLYEIASAI